MKMWTFFSWSHILSYLHRTEKYYFKISSGHNHKVERLMVNHNETEEALMVMRDILILNRNMCGLSMGSLLFNQASSPFFGSQRKLCQLFVLFCARHSHF
jgi:hypothetical protein